MAKTSKIYLCKDINVDNEYTNVLNYTVQQMLDLCTSNAHLVASANNYSFIRESEYTISVGFTYSQCLQSNYIVFQNSDYSNKWFFAWIKDVKYVSEASTQITFEVDAWSTWFNDLTITRSFVIREHVNSDNIGEHTIPEGLETGEYISDYSTTFDFGTAHIVMGTLVDPGDGKTPVAGGEYGGIMSCCGYYIFESGTDLNNALTKIASEGNTDSIVSLFYCPDWITKYSTADFDSDGIAEVPNTSTATEGSGIIIPLSATKIGNYTPKNNKIFVYPYRAYIVSNNAGSSVEYHMEDFNNSGDNLGRVTVYGTCCPGASIRLIPQYYKAYDRTYSEQLNNEYGLTGGKFPIASYPNDAYTNWLTQNSVNIGIQTIGSILTITGGAIAMATGGGAVAGATMIAGSLGIANQMASVYQHTFNPVHADGNTNSGDVTYSAGKLSFTGFMMTIKEEYAKSIDEYFTRFGYKVNRLKTPNITGRQYWNYIQIGTGEELGKGPVPTKYMDIINQVARNGVTIWHNHTNIGNYNLNNSII